MYDNFSQFRVIPVYEDTSLPSSVLLSFTASLCSTATTDQFHRLTSFSYVLPLGALIPRFDQSEDRVSRINMQQVDAQRNMKRIM